MNRRSLGFTLGGLLVALLLAGVVSNFASASPDGLESALHTGCTVDAEGNITGGTCPARQARDHELAESPLADYGLRGIDNPYLSTALAGVLGVLLTFALGAGLLRLARRSTPPGSRTGESSTAGSPTGDSSMAAGSPTGDPAPVGPPRRSEHGTR